MEKTVSPESAKGFEVKKALRLLVSVVLVVGIFWYMQGQVADFSVVWEHVRAMTTQEIAILVAFAAWNLVTYWIVIVASTPGLKYRQAAVVSGSSTAVANTLPGGSAIAMALTYSMFGSWGFSKSRTTLSLVVSGIWNNFIKLGMPVLALALLAVQGEASGARVLTGLFGIAALVGAVTVFALMLRSDDFARRAGEGFGRLVSRPLQLFNRPPVKGWGDATTKFRGRVIGIVRRKWLWLTVSSLIGHASLFAVLVVTMRNIGISNDEVGWIEALAVFAFVRLLTAIPITPGGLGIVELGFIGGLSSAGGNREEVVAAVLVYRVLTYVVPIVLGVGTYIFWRRNTSWLDTAPPLDPALSAPALASV